MKDRLAEYDFGIVTRIRESGFTILGKTATSELGSLPYTEPAGFPPARNPWNLDYTPGGSSGGAAAAVAAGLCAIAQGSDAGGSVRGPACCCGLVGIKPARGRISYAPVGDRLSGIASLGPLARTVADAAALLDIMSGYITGDPYWLPEPNPSFLAATTQPPSSLRIAFTTNVPPLGKADATCQQTVLDIVNLLEELGHRVEQSCPDFTDLTEPFTAVWQAGVASAVSQMQIIARRILAFFDTVDVLVLPTYLHPTIRVGEWVNLNPEETFQKIIDWVAPCPPFNATGQPAIALPTGFDSNGLPLGIQLVGRPAAEATIIALAAQIEAAKPWSQHRPAFANC